MSSSPDLTCMMRCSSYEALSDVERLTAEYEQNLVEIKCLLHRNDEIALEIARAEHEAKDASAWADILANMHS